MLVIWSHDTRLKTYPTSTGSASGLPDLRRTSRWPRLLKVTSLLFKFISRLQRREEDYEINYVMKTLQQEFIEELEFILDPLGGGGRCLAWSMFLAYSWTGRDWSAPVAELIGLCILDMTIRTPFSWERTTLSPNLSWTAILDVLIWEWGRLWPSRNEAVTRFPKENRRSHF